MMLRDASHPPILEPLRAYARERGLLDADIGRLWASHCRGSLERGYDPGGTPWRRYVDSAVERQNEEGGGDVVRLSEQAQLRARQAEAERKAKEATDAAYARESVGFGDYLDSLVTKVHLEPAEAHVLMFSRQPGEDVGTYLMRAMTSPAPTDEELGFVGGGDRFLEDAPPPAPVRARPAYCATDGCPHPVRTWQREGRAYAAALCERCDPRMRIGASLERQLIID